MSAIVHPGEPLANIRVTHVVFDLNGGGMESLVAAMAVRFAQARPPQLGSVTMSVITLSGREGRVGAATRPYLEQYKVLKQTPGLSMLFPVSLVRNLRATNPDVVHIHSGSWYKGSLAARLAGVRRIVFTEHGREHFDPPYAKWIDRRAAARTDVVVAVTRRLEHYLHTALGVPTSRLCSITNGVDTDGFTPGPKPDDLQQRLGIPPDAYVVGSIGRLAAVKAYHQLVESVAQLIRSGQLARPLYLVICGEGGERQALEDRVSSLGIGANVRLPGWTDRPADFYRLLDVFALTSLSEGASVSLMEAMATGVTPVVTNVGGNAELMGSALAAQVVPAGDQAAFTEVLGETLLSADRRRRVSVAVRERAVDHYSLDRMVTAYERIYRGLPIRDVVPVEVG